MATFPLRSLTKDIVLTCRYSDNLVQSAFVEAELQRQYTNVCYAQELYLTGSKMIKRARMVPIPLDPCVRINIPMTVTLTGVQFPRCDFVLAQNVVLREERHTLTLVNQRYPGLKITVKKCAASNDLLTRGAPMLPVKVIDSIPFLAGEQRVRSYVDLSDFNTTGSFVLYGDDSELTYHIVPWRLERRPRGLAELREWYLAKSRDIYRLIFEEQPETYAALVHILHPDPHHPRDIVGGIDVLDAATEPMEGRYLRRTKLTPVWETYFDTVPPALNSKRISWEEFLFIIAEKRFCALSAVVELFININPHWDLYAALFDYQQQIKGHPVA